MSIGFVAQASLPPLYHNLLSLPLTDRELETRLEVDVGYAISPMRRELMSGGQALNNSGVSNNNRVIERHTSRYGAYWKSYDFAGSVGTQNIFTHPLSISPMMEERLSLIFPTGCKPTMLPMRPVSVWTMHR